MTQTVTLELPEEVARSAQNIAVRTQRRLEDVLIDWIDHAAAELPVEDLPDDQLLALCDLELDPTLQKELSELLAANREGILTPSTRARLEQLMQLYRRGLVRKAQAIKEAVDRGLRPLLS